MGLGDILGGIFGSQNNFKATPVVNNYNAQAMGGVNAASPALGNAASNYAAQGDYINLLQGAAQGNAPSVAQNLLTQGVDRNNAAAASTMAGARGMNPGLAAKMAMDQMGQNNQAGAQSASLLRAQEMAGARGMLGGALGQQAQSNLGAGQLALGQQGQQLGDYWNAQGINAGVAGQNAGLASHAQDVNAGIAGQNTASNNALMGGLINAGGAVASMAAFSHGGEAGKPLDSPKNDVVHALLSPHEIVLPRSVTLAEDAPERARDFVRAIKGHKPEHRMAPWKMDAGGEVPRPGPANYKENAATDPGMPPLIPPRNSPIQNASENNHGWNPLAAEPKKPPAKMAHGGDVDYPEKGGESQPDPLSGAEPLPDPWATPTTSQFMSGSTVGAPSAAAPADAPEVPATQGPGMLARPSDEEMQATTRVAPQDNSPKAPQSIGELSAMMSGQKQEQAGIEGQAANTAKFAGDEKSIIDERNKKLEENNTAFQQAMKDHQVKSEQLFNDAMSSKINPRQYWEQMSTGGKITSAIGMILGGIGSGLSGQPNAALGVIEKAIDRDVEAQKLNINKKQNLLSHYMELGHDLQQSHLLASADMHDVAAGKLAAASAAYQGTNAAASAQIEVGKLRQQGAVQRLQARAMDFGNKEKEIGMQYMMWQMGAKQALSGGGQRVNPEMLDKDTRERVVDTPNGDQRLAPTGKDADEFRKTMEAKEEFQSTLDRMRAFRKLHSGGTWFSGGMSAATATGKALHANAITHLNKIADLARFTPEEHQQFEEQISRPDAFSMSDASFNAQLDELQKMLDARLSSAMRNRLEGPKASMPPITRSAGQ